MDCMKNITIRNLPVVQQTKYKNCKRFGSITILMYICPANK